MKFKLFFLTIGALAVLSFTLQKYSKPTASAIVNEYEGYLVFSDCKPAQPYKVLGRVQKGTMGADYEGQRDALITAVKRKYPQADGMIMNFHASDVHPNADVIEFED